MDFLKNKSILVTGGTGSFGKNFTKQLLNNFDIKKVVIFSRDEYKQYQFKKSLNKKDSEKVRFFLGDVRDKDRLDIALNDIDIVIHAAALKQVDTAEYNPIEPIKTNIIGAENIIEVCLKKNVQKVIALSTDKAVHPINLYGATKLVSDKLFIAANNLVGFKKIRFSVVRYGNVLNSRGSAVPLFRSLASKSSNYISITDKEMTRFWIDLDTSVKFVLKALKIMKGAEVFVPKMPSVNIMDMAKAIAPKNKIKITGIRPGEKIHEILVPKDPSSLTMELNDFFVMISRSIFIKKLLNESTNNILKLKGKKVDKNFEYASNTNKKFLTVKEIKSFVANSKEE